jgi:hypothetical protein
MAETRNKKEVLIGFNKLKKQLPHRYTTVIAETLTDITAVQVKCVFKGEIKNPVVVKKVYDAALQVAKEFNKTKRLARRKTHPKGRNTVNQ